MSQIDDINDLQELKEQYKLIEEKLDTLGNAVRDDLILRRAMRTVSKIRNQHKREIAGSMFFIPVVFMFAILEFPWWYLVAIILFAGMHFLLNMKGYNMFDSDRLLASSMSDASESLIKNRKWRIKSYKIMVVPTIVFVLLTIYVAGNGEFLIGSSLGAAIIMLAGLIGGAIREWRKMKQLNHALERIEEIRNK